MTTDSDIQTIKLTQYSHGAGYGCKIAPKVLDQILQHEGGKAYFKNLLVGNEERDDAAVMDLGDGTAIISTTYIQAIAIRYISTGELRFHKMESHVNRW